MSAIRHMTDQEAKLVARLIELSPNHWKNLPDIDSLQVIEMSDGGMGSLKFVGSGNSKCRLISEAQSKDSDGVVISVALMVDEEFKLSELDIWKVDFSRVQKLPDPLSLVVSK